MSISENAEDLGRAARAAGLKLALADSEKKNQALLAMAKLLESRKEFVFAENAKDLAQGKADGLSDALLDRLKFTEERFASMVQGLREVASLPDPVGAELSQLRPSSGIEISKVRVPIGVIAIIYESRPNVTADAAALCVKTSNAVILRGGKEARHSNVAIADILIEAAEEAGLPESSIQFVRTAERDFVRELVQQEETVDLVIPRGGEGLIRAVAEMSRVPVLKHYKGVCHIYVDASANLDMAESIVLNAKCQRPSVCNALETLLVDRGIAEEFLPRLEKSLLAQGVELRADEQAQKLMPSAIAAEEEDWDAEYLDLTLAIAVVDGVERAVEHVNRYGSRHTDAVIAEDPAIQQAFSAQVDTAVVMINASTRFNDGGQFGLGAEMGISTDKLHARGPVGPEELTTYKYIVRGTGQVRE